MNKKVIIIIVLAILLVSISGCTNKNATNGTFGQKTISIKNITVSNNVTAENVEYNGTNYYWIHGNIRNNNPYDAFNLKMKAVTYDKDGNVVAVKDTFNLDPKIIAANGESYFSFTFNNSDNRIIRYEIQLISADA